MSFRTNSSSAVRSSVPESATERILVVSRWNVGWAAGSPGCPTRTNLLSSRSGSLATCQANVTMVVVDLVPHVESVNPTLIGAASGPLTNTGVTNHPCQVG